VGARQACDVKGARLEEPWNVCKWSEQMPYQTNADLPKEQTDQYDRHQKDAFRQAFNNAYKEYGGDESRAFATAHAAAKRAGARERVGRR
jgi:cation transport regulator